MITIKTKPCPSCGLVQELQINPDDLALWKSGTLIQNTFPYLTPSQRESLITGYCDPCWEKLFKEDED